MSCGKEKPAHPEKESRNLRNQWDERTSYFEDIMKLAWQIKQYDGVKIPTPFCEHANHAFDNFHINQVVTSGKFSGTTKVRSLKENNLYFKACKVFREMMMPDPRWQHSNVDHWFRYYCGHVDPKKAMVMPNGVIHFPVLPLNFKGCEQANANKYYNKAFTAMAEEFLGVEKDVFIQEVKSQCGGR